MPRAHALRSIGLRALAFLAAAALAAACSSGDSSAGADAVTADSAPSCNVEPTIESLEQNYFRISCALPSCHSGNSPEAGLDLSVGNARASLVGVESTEAPPWIRVVAGDPDASFIVRKVTAPEAGEGDLMPPGVQEPLDPDCRIAALRQWIADGAN